MNNTHSTLVHHFLENTASIYPQHLAVIHDQKKITFSQLNKRANQIAIFLQQRLIHKGDRIGIIFKNSIDYIGAYFGVLKSGAIAVPLNTENTAESLSLILNDCRVTGIISQNRYNKLIYDIAPSIHSLKWITYQEQILENPFPDKIEIFNLVQIYKTEPDHFLPERMIDADIACIMYTSGSTGKPKGVTLSHLNIVSNTKSIVSYLNLTHQDKILVVLPFHYCYGKSLLHTHFYVGGTVVLDNRFLYPHAILETMKNQHITGFSGVPSTFSILLNHIDLSKQSFPDLRYVTQAGGALAPAMIKNLMKIMPDKKIYIMYGATEASARLAYLEPTMLESKLRSVGKAIPNVELTIIRENGQKASVGEIGEIVARGSNIMLGYWNDKIETSNVLHEDGYHTGDLARIDEDGYIYIIGRKNDMVKVGGNRFNIKEVEETLYQHPAVAEVAIIAVPDAILGEVLKAFIVPRNKIHLLEQELKIFCKTCLVKFKRPRDFEIVTSLPRNSSGKILKQHLSSLSSLQDSI